MNERTSAKYKAKANLEAHEKEVHSKIEERKAKVDAMAERLGTVSAVNVNHFVHTVNSVTKLSDIHHRDVELQAALQLLEQYAFAYESIVERLSKRTHEFQFQYVQKLVQTGGWTCLAPGLATCGQLSGYLMENLGDSEVMLPMAELATLSKTMEPLNYKAPKQVSGPPMNSLPAENSVPSKDTEPDQDKHDTKVDFDAIYD